MTKHPDARYAPYHPLGADHPFSLFVEKGWALRCDCWDCDHEV
jgi:hypothetical protein